MSAAADFLNSLAQAVSTATLYQSEHPARRKAVARAHERLALLQEESPRATFTFLDAEVVLDGVPLREMRAWGWGRRLAAAGIQRLELTGPVERDDFDAFVDEVLGRLGHEPRATAEVRQFRPTNIRYGTVGLHGHDGEEGDVPEVATATLGYDLKDEIDTVQWLHDELKGRDQLHLLEAEGIVRSLSVAMHGDQAFLVPLLRLKEYDQYTTTHALNVSVLAMALSEFIGLSPREVRMFGISGLLHDLGKVTIPDEILNKPGKLTDQERLVMNNHTIEGARIILETEEHLDLAAVVAYEHHIKLDGGGYPTLAYPRACHQASDLVHVCDVFDALRTDRPYREAWPLPRVLKLLEEGAGTEFDPELTRAFLRMMEHWEGRIAEIDPDQPEVPIGGGGAGGADPAGEDGTDAPADDGGQESAGSATAGG